MAKIPFTLEAWLKDKSQRVETQSGFPAKILHCDGYGESPILVTVDLGDGCGVQTRLYFADGKLYKEESDADLFIVTPEPELTNWEEFISGCLQKHGLLDCGAADRIAKECSAELLDLARKEFVKQGYVIEKKLFHDAVEKIDDKHKAEMRVEYSLHCKVEDGIRHAVMNWNEFQKVTQHFIDCGKAEALKDLPRWKEYDASGASRGELSLILYSGVYEVSDLFIDKGLYIPISDLEKLPGFNQ